MKSGQSEKLEQNRLQLTAPFANLQSPVSFREWVLLGRPPIKSSSTYRKRSGYSAAFAASA